MEPEAAEQPQGTVQNTDAQQQPVDWRTLPRMTARRRKAAAAGCVVLRSRLYEDKDSTGMPVMPFERKGKDLIMRVLIENVNAEIWAGIKDAFKGNKPYLMLDKTGVVCHMRDTLANGQKVMRHSKDRILQVLPKGADLPQGISWSDFTDRQLVALALLTDVMSSNTRAQVAAIAGVDEEELGKWEGSDKFLRVKRWLLERQKHRIREEAMKNLAAGQGAEDEGLRLAYTKLGLEVLGLTGGKRDKNQGQAGTKDPKLVEDVQAELGDMSLAEKQALAHELKLTASILTGENQVMLSGDGSTLSAKPKEEV